MWPRHYCHRGSVRHVSRVTCPEIVTRVVAQERCSGRAGVSVLGKVSTELVLVLHIHFVLVFTFFDSFKKCVSYVGLA